MEILEIVLGALAPLAGLAKVTAGGATVVGLIGIRELSRNSNS